MVVHDHPERCVTAAETSTSTDCPVFRMERNLGMLMIFAAHERHAATQKRPVGAVGGKVPADLRIADIVSTQLRADQVSLGFCYFQRICDSAQEAYDFDQLHSNCLLQGLNSCLQLSAGGPLPSEYGLPH